MTNEQFMQPRVILENLYPSCPYDVGEILYQFKGYYAAEDKSRPMEINEVKKYPYLFRPLFWWEFRDEKNMPGYVKTKSGKWVWKFYGFGSLGKDYAKVEESKNRSNYPFFDLLPATSEEYQLFINGKK